MSSAASATHIRAAQADDAALLSGLAMRSKAHWGYSAEFMEACREELTYSALHFADSTTDFFVAETAGAVAGFCAVQDLGNAHFELDSLFVEPSNIGNGVGRALLHHATQVVAQRGGTSLLIQGDPHARGFYIAAGAQPVGSRESGSIPGRFLPLFEIQIPAGLTAS